VSIEGLDARLRNLERELKDHSDGAITLKKVRAVVEDAIEA
jgi:predicted nuclease with TOPRIM domain